MNTMDEVLAVVAKENLIALERELIQIKSVNEHLKSEVVSLRKAVTFYKRLSSSWYTKWANEKSKNLQELK
jgi:hypothetical protein